MRRLLMFVLLAALGTGISAAQEKGNKKGNAMVEIKTTLGDIKVMLYDETPLHKENFIKLAKEGFYDGLLFHRVIEMFMIQAGDPVSRNAPANTQLGSGGPGYTVPAEMNTNLIHKKGALAAARMPDHVNPKKESSGSQFYIVQGRIFNADVLKSMSQQTGITYTEKQKEIYQTIGGTPHLDGGYTVFGEVVSGLDVVDAIAAVKTGQANRPIEDVKIISIKVIE